MPLPEIVPSVEYKQAMYSVNLIKEIVDSGETDAPSLELKQSNQEHLVAILAKDFWTTEDLQPFRDAIAL